MNTALLRANFLGLLVFLGALLSIQALWADETLETLVKFNGKNGAYPGSIIQGPRGNFYGTTYSGGKYDRGTLFEIPLNKPVVTLFDFDGPSGANPASDLLQWTDGSFYGTTLGGGKDGKGTIFQLTPDGKVKTVCSFNGDNGAYPTAGLLIGLDGNFYGTTYSGGTANKGTLFAATADGDLKTLVHFTGENGVNPGSLVRAPDGTFYGTTFQGGANNKGLVFKYDPDPALTTIFTFDGKNGANPLSQLCLSNGSFYGTTNTGGSHDMGVIFQLTMDGVLNIITEFDGHNGSHPNSGLVQWTNGYFYMERLWDNLATRTSTAQWAGIIFCGTTSGGGDHGNGTVFRVSSDGSLTTMVSFTGMDGLHLGTLPNSLIPGNDGNLYGTTFHGGPTNQGTVFRLLVQSLTPPAGATQTAAITQVPAVISP